MRRNQSFQRILNSAPIKVKPIEEINGFNNQNNEQDSISSDSTANSSPPSSPIIKVDNNQDKEKEDKSLNVENVSYSPHNIINGFYTYTLPILQNNIKQFL